MDRLLFGGVATTFCSALDLSIHIKAQSCISNCPAAYTTLAGILKNYEVTALSFTAI